MTKRTLSRLLLAFMVVFGQPLSVSFSQQINNSSPTPSPAIRNVDASSTVRDVRLEPGGRVNLQVVSLIGQHLDGEHVTISFQDKAIATAATDSNGRVLVNGLRPGIHTVHVSGSTQMFRFWAPETAPPSATTNPAVVVGAETALGQYGAPMMPMMAPGFLATAVTATALTAVLIGKNRSGSKADIPASP